MHALAPLLSRAALAVPLALTFAGCELPSLVEGGDYTDPQDYDAPDAAPDLGPLDPDAPLDDANQRFAHAAVYTPCVHDGRAPALRWVLSPLSGCALDPAPPDRLVLTLAARPDEPSPLDGPFEAPVVYPIGPEALMIGHHVDRRGARSPVVAGAVSVRWVDPAISAGGRYDVRLESGERLTGAYIAQGCGGEPLPGCFSDDVEWTDAPPSDDGG